MINLYHGTGPKPALCPVNPGENALTFVLNKKHKVMQHHTPTALITGASKGLGLTIATALAQRGWNLIINARNAQQLRAAQRSLEGNGQVIAISGDVRDEIHLLQFQEVLEREQLTLDLVINNASALGTSPLPTLLEYPIDDLHRVFHTNTIAPLSLLQKIRSFLAPEVTVINVSSDAAAEAYETWGGYGSSKAALDQWTAILAKEQPAWKVYAFDPGDMRTYMHQQAFPGEDISDRPLPREKAVPALLHLIYERPQSGRYTTASLLPETPGAGETSNAYYMTLIR